jgi:gluconate kinase
MKMKVSIIMVMVLASLNLLGQRNNNLLHGEAQVAKMKAELSLSDDQVVKLQEINDAFEEARMKLEGDTAISREDLASAKAKILRDRNKGLMEVLTKDQFSKWMETMRGQSRNRTFGRGTSHESLQQMKTALGLSDQQVKDIIAINTHMTAEFKKLRADTAIAREDRSAEVKKIMVNRNTEIKKVLSEEQYVKFLEHEGNTNMNRRPASRAPGKK